MARQRRSIRLDFDEEHYADWRRNYQNIDVAKTTALIAG
jgi:hypothetical protein